MILQVFTVYDAKAELFLTPFFMRTKGEALRAIGDAVNDPSHQFHRHAVDYSLYHLGEFEEKSGSLLMHVEPQAMVNLAELKDAQLTVPGIGNGTYAQLGNAEDAEEEHVV